MVPANIVFPSLFYNTIMIMVTSLTLLWAMKAIKRLHYMLRIRSTVLTERVIQIRGLGSFLSYFEGASQAHINAIVHTRQAKPPISMNVAFFPYVISEPCLIRNGHLNYELELNLTSSVNCKVVVLFNFKSSNFAAMFHKFRKLNASNINEDGSSQIAFLENLLQVGSLGNSSARGLFDKPPSHHSSSSSSSSDAAHRATEARLSGPLSQSGTCEYQVLMQDAPAGRSSMVFQLLGNMTTFVGLLAARRLAQQTAAPPAVAPPVAEGEAQPMMAPAGPAGTALPTTARLPEEDLTLNIAVLIVPNITAATLAANRASSKSRGSGAGAGVLGLTRPNNSGADRPSSQSTPSTLDFDAVAPGSPQKKPSSPGKGKVVIPLGGGGERERERGSAGSDLEMGNFAAGEGGGSSGDSLLSSSPPTAASIKAQRKKNKKMQDAAPVCSGLFTLSVPLGKVSASAPVNSAVVSPLQTQKGGDAAGQAGQYEPMTVPLGIADLLVLDQCNNLYSAQEIFGLNSATVASTAAAAPPVVAPPTSAPAGAAAASSTAPAAASSTGGKYVPEDCAVCLTDPKEIALLPCRHLCVCVSCLIYIDKCPVCRAAFEEYVVIQGSKPVQLDVPVLHDE